MKNDIAVIFICIGLVFGALVSALVVSQQVKVIEKVVPSACASVQCPACSVSCPKCPQLPSISVPEPMCLTPEGCIEFVKGIKKVVRQ